MACVTGNNKANFSCKDSKLLELYRVGCLQQFWGELVIIES